MPSRHAYRPGAGDDPEEDPEGERERSEFPERQGRPQRKVFRGPAGPVDLGLVRKEWARGVEERRAQTAARGPVPKKARLAPSWWQKLFEPFEVFFPPLPEGYEEDLPPLSEVLVPEAERAYAREQAAQFARGYGVQRPGYERPGPAPARPSYERPERSERPSYERPSAGGSARVTPEYVNGIINLEQLFGHVEALRKDPEFKGEAGVGILAPAGIDPWGKVLKVAEFFGIPKSVYESVSREEAWKKVIEPFLGQVQTVLNQAKPPTLPGRFVFGGPPNGPFGLIYQETRA